jgi:hypothetical protein
MVYRCPVFFGGFEKDQGYDCAFYLDETNDVAQPGGPSVVVPVKFFVREFVEDELRPGATFILWEGRDVGEAEVLEVLHGK